MAAIGVALMLVAPAYAITAQVNTNSPQYWETQLGHNAQCFKHEGNSAHGYITQNGKGVVLNPFQQQWPGDHWEALIVKGGNVDVGNGPGNALYVHPTAGTVYTAPANAGGNIPAVSHWIACKGTTPRPTTTTLPPTTTTIPTTTVPTTTVPPSCPDTIVIAPGRPYTFTVPAGDTTIVFTNDSSSRSIGSGQVGSYGSVDFPEDLGASTSFTFTSDGGDVTITTDGKFSGCIEISTVPPTTTTTVPDTTTTAPPTTLPPTTVTEPPTTTTTKPPGTSTTTSQPPPETTTTTTTTVPPTSEVPPTTEVTIGNFTVTCEGVDVFVAPGSDGWFLSATDESGDLVKLVDGAGPTRQSVPLEPGEYHLMLVINGGVQQSTANIIPVCQPTLPYTGLPMTAIAAIGLALLGLGVTMKGLTDQ